MNKKLRPEQAEKLTFRLAPEYAREVYRLAVDAGLTPNQIGRMATMFLVRNRFHEFPEKFGRMEEAFIRLFRELQELLSAEEDSC